MGRSKARNIPVPNPRPRRKRSKIGKEKEVPTRKVNSPVRAIPINRNFLISIFPVFIPIPMTKTNTLTVKAGATKPRSVSDTLKLSLISGRNEPLSWIRIPPKMTK
ncbi:hypothetical protein AKJ65_03325 [candidate division MSBL1 archaeon SCGC-AAA259E19]|uniref:Uncharacterized protein n=1 Tax=candidate division MSBL1 archaeon SCGC-AAA259E19 TaxID=1698264 RepID=A0A133UKS6_9EURY|nr:hypothetical protein AKJ65_03325 [candidate division MSBL1 archaeon SCGC-AAA259E19]